VGLVTQETILLLQDDRAVMEHMRGILKRYILIEAATADQALRRFSDCGRHVDLLVANVTIAASSGVEVALAFRSELPRLPVIISSGLPTSLWSQRNKAAFGLLGPELVAVVERPILTQALFDTVWELLGSAHTRKALTAS